MSQLYARKLVTLVVAALVAATVAVLPTPAAAEVSTRSAATWSAPTLSNPIDIELRPGNQDVRLDPARDYRLKIVQPLTDPGGLVVSGGRNVMISGGEIRVPDVVEPTKRRGMYLKGQTGTIHVEGVHLAGPYLSEGINLDQRLGATVQFRNIRVDRVQGTQAGNHADLIQTWAGPKTLRIDGFQGESNYQGMFLLPRQLFPEAQLQDWEFRNVDVRLTADAGYGFWKDAGHDIALDNVHLSREGGSTWKSFWPNTSQWLGASFGAPFSSVLGSILPGMSYAVPGFGDANAGTPPTTAPPTTAPPTTAPPTTAPPTTAPPTTAPPVSPPTTSAPVTGPPTTVPVTVPTTTPPPTTTPDNGSVATPTVSEGPTGYWQVAADGGVFSFGDARFHGSVGGMSLNKPVTGIASTPGGVGYWLVASDGGIFAFGDARFAGSTGGMSLNQPIVGMASTPSGNGYWLVARDGGIFAFGDARFAGSTGGMSLNQPITAMAATRSGKGYWLVARDGGIFSFGDAAFFGSAANLASSDVTGVRPAKNGRGYALDASNGGVFAFGDAAFRGSMSGRLNAPIVGSTGF